MQHLDAFQAMADASADGTGRIPIDKSSSGIVQAIPVKGLWVWITPDPSCNAAPMGCCPGSVPSPQPLQVAGLLPHCMCNVYV